MQESIEDVEPIIPLSVALWGSEQSTPPFLCQSLAGEIVVNDETHKLAITIAAAIFAARALTDWDGKRSPRLIAGVANAIEKAKLLVSTLEAKG